MKNKLVFYVEEELFKCELCNSESFFIIRHGKVQCTVCKTQYLIADQWSCE